MIVRYGLRRVVGVVVAVREHRSPSEAFGARGRRPRSSVRPRGRVAADLAGATAPARTHPDPIQEHDMNALLNEELARQRHREAHQSAQRHRRARDVRPVVPMPRSVRVLHRMVRPARAR